LGVEPAAAEPGPDGPEVSDFQLEVVPDIQFLAVMIRAVDVEGREIDARDFVAHPREVDRVPPDAARGVEDRAAVREAMAFQEGRNRLRFRFRLFKPLL